MKSNKKLLICKACGRLLALLNTEENYLCPKLCIDCRENIEDQNEKIKAIAGKIIV